MTDTSVADTKPQGAAAEVLNSPPPAPAFWESFQDAETKTWAEQGGFKSAEDVAARARKFDAFKDVDPSTLRALPKADDPNAFVAFAREHLGAPTEASAYGLEEIEGVDKDLAAAAQAWFHEAGVTKFQGQHLAAKQMEFMKAIATAQVAEDKAGAERELSQLKTDLGETKYKETTELGRRALKAGARAAGLDAKAIDDVVGYIESGMGVGATVKLFSFFGQFIKEGEFIDGAVNDTAPAPLQERMYKDI